MIQRPQLALLLTVLACAGPARADWPSPTPYPTAAPTRTPTRTPVRTQTPIPTWTPTAAPTPAPVDTPPPTPTPPAYASPTPTGSPTLDMAVTTAVVVLRVTGVRIGAMVTFRVNGPDLNFLGSGGGLTTSDPYSVFAFAKNYPPGSWMTATVNDGAGLVLTRTAALP